MKTDVDIKYVSPITYELFEWELPAREPVAPPEAEASDVSQNDLGYFMTMAGRHKLLTAEEERTLGAALWTARRRLLRILRRARADSDEFPAIETSPPTHPVTHSTRRRLAKVERLARELNEGVEEARSRRTRGIHENATSSPSDEPERYAWGNGRSPSRARGVQPAPRRLGREKIPRARLQLHRRHPRRKPEGVHHALVADVYERLRAAG